MADNWIIYLIFLLVGYLLRLLCEPKNKADKKKSAFIMPTINPVKIIKENKEKKEQEQFDRETKIMLENIERYNGTSEGQVEVK